MKRSPSPGASGGGYKKSRGGEDEMENTFEDELLAMEASEAMLMGEELIDIDGMDTSITGAAAQRRWLRPRPVHLNPTTDNLGNNSQHDSGVSLNVKISDTAIQWYDIDMTSGEPLAANPSGGAMAGSLEGPVPVVRLFGVSQSGASVMASVHGFTPYFFASVPNSFELNVASMSACRVVFDQKVLYMHPI